LNPENQIVVKTGKNSKLISFYFFNIGKYFLTRSRTLVTRLLLVFISKGAYFSKRKQSRDYTLSSFEENENLISERPSLSWSTSADLD
jgi:hypothetical protein